MPAPIIGRPGEYTKVGVETEVKIPEQTYVRDGLISSIITTGAWLIAWLLWFQSKAKQMAFGTWVSRYWGRWIGVWWPMVLISFILCWCGLSALLYRYRLGIEQVVKNPPPYAQWDPENGMWHPWVNRHKRKSERMRRRIEHANLRATYYRQFGRGEDEDE